MPKSKHRASIEQYGPPVAVKTTTDDPSSHDFLKSSGELNAKMAALLDRLRAASDG